MLHYALGVLPYLHPFHILVLCPSCYAVSIKEMCRHCTQSWQDCSAAPHGMHVALLMHVKTYICQAASSSCCCSRLYAVGDRCLALIKHMWTGMHLPFMALFQMNVPAMGKISQVDFKQGVPMQHVTDTSEREMSKSEISPGLYSRRHMPGLD